MNMNVQSKAILKQEKQLKQTSVEEISQSTEYTDTVSVSPLERKKRCGASLASSVILNIFFVFGFCVLIMILVHDKRQINSLSNLKQINESNMKQLQNELQAQEKSREKYLNTHLESVPAKVANMAETSTEVGKEQENLFSILCQLL